MATTKRKAKKKVSPDVPPPRADPDAKLTQSQLRQLQKALLEERTRLVEAINRHVSEATGEEARFSEEGDLASHAAGQAYLLRYADKEYKKLQQVLKALRKLEEGEYGVCEGTGEPIGYKRLKIRPWTRYSVHYKEELERLKAQTAR